MRAWQAEERIARVSGEAAEAHAAAAAAKAAGREWKEKAAAAARDAGLRRDEVSRLKGEVERSRAACAEKVLKALFAVYEQLRVSCFKSARRKVWTQYPTACESTCLLFSSTMMPTPTVPCSFVRAFSSKTLRVSLCSLPSLPLCSSDGLGSGVGEQVQGARAAVGHYRLH